MANPRIKVTDLAFPCLTRPRGEEAYAKFRPLIDEHGAVDLDLDAKDAPSSSFLDEIILKLQSSGHLDRVTFVTRSDRIKSRLSTIADIRHVALYFKPDSESQVRLLPKKSPSNYKAEYERKQALA